MNSQNFKSVTVNPESTSPAIASLPATHGSELASDQTLPQVASEVIEHQNVPQEHRGLHDFLYSSADEHGAEPAPEIATVAAVTAPVEDWCNANAKVAGVYAVLNSRQQTQYIGYSRNVSLSLRSHLIAHGAEVCALVRVQPFKFPKREEMEQLRDQWLVELPSPPSGNTDGSADWASTVRSAQVTVMSEVDRAAYEEKKLKLRKAMADGSLHREESAASQHLAAKIQDDNWSAVISEQTKETM